MMGFPTIGPIRSFRDIEKALQRIRSYFDSGEAGNIVAPIGPVKDSMVAIFDGTTGRRLKGSNDRPIIIEGLKARSDLMPTNLQYLCISISGYKVYLLIAIPFPFVDSWLPRVPDFSFPRDVLSRAIVSGSFFYFEPWDIYVNMWLPRVPDFYLVKKILSPAIVGGSFFYEGAFP